jgi:hypothetical protein
MDPMGDEAPKTISWTAPYLLNQVTRPKSVMKNWRDAFKRRWAKKITVREAVTASGYTITNRN